MKNIQKEVEWINNSFLNKVEIKNLLETETGLTCFNFYKNLHNNSTSIFTKKEIELLKKIKKTVQKSIKNCEYNFIKKKTFNTFVLNNNYEHELKELEL